MGEGGAQNYIVRNFNKMDGTCGTQATLGYECKILVLKLKGRDLLWRGLCGRITSNTQHTNRVKAWIKEHWLGAAVGCANFDFRNDRY